MEVKRVLIENWLTTSQLWAIYIPIIISVSSLIVAVWSLYYTRKDIVASHRPFVRMVQPVNVNFTVEDFFYIRCLNAPARILVKTEYYGIESNGNEKLLYSRRDSSESVIFPKASDNDQTTHSENFKFNDIKEYSKVKRCVLIDYKELSSERKYFFKINIIFEILERKITSVKEEAN